MTIYTAKAKTWKATNTQEKIDTLFTPAVRSRFWSKTEIVGECWNWTGALLTHGYGNFGVRQMNFRAPRVAYMISHGPIPANLHILHSCNNRRCVNPAHLSIGTVQRNLRERDLHGDLAHGERNGRAKLTAEDVRAIRASDEKPSVLGRKYGVHPSTIYNARIGKKWARLEAKQ